MDHTKYRPYAPMQLADRTWPSKVITQAPIWSSVDLRDGNQALPVPMGVEKKLAMYNLLKRVGFKEIEVWGVDMAVGSEYQNQRPSCEFWLGVAAGMGIKIHIPAEADLLKSRFLYGFEEPLQNEFTKKMKKLRTDMIAKLNSANNQLVMAQKTVEQYQGAIHAAQEIDKIWSNFDDKITVTAS